MPDISPEMLARIDQTYQQSRERLPDAIEAARLLVQQHGPAKAAALVAVEHVEMTDGHPYLLAGALGTALVELARRDASDA